MTRILRPQIGYPRVRTVIAGRTVEVPQNLPPARMEPSQPGALGPEQGMYIRLPGANFPPAGSTPVDEMGDANIAPGASAVMITINVPDARRFRMAGIGFTADDETSLQFLSWTIAAPDPTPGYIDKSSAVGSVRNLTEIFFLVGSSVACTIIGESAINAVTTYRFIARVRGWLYAEKEAQ
jgi:hypothetical protein